MEQNTDTIVDPIKQVVLDQNADAVVDFTKHEVSEVINIVTLDWTMFKKETTLGYGAFGTVYKVKAIVSSVIISSGG